MPRSLRRVDAGLIYHILNRGNGRRMLFAKDADYLAFFKMLNEGLDRFAVDVLAYCLMGNHWHLMLRPRSGDALPRFMAWLGTTHARRYHAHRPQSGAGHVYQGRYKSFPVQDDAHFLTVARYIHANPLRAGLVRRAQDWPWSSLSPHGSAPPLAEWPLDRPANWTALVNSSMDERELARVRTSIARGRPFGSDKWTGAIASRLRLTSSLAPRGRPRKPLAELSPRQKRRRAASPIGHK